ncbi:MAG: outer membrane beta-barrel protein [Paludibacter sp.]|jgi:opacity protein-like surface antigen
MKKAFIIVLFFMQQVFTLTTNAQTTVPTTEKKEIQSKIELKPYFSNVTSKAVSQFDGLEIREYYYNKRPQYGVEALYKINEFWSVGLNLGYSVRTLSNNSLQSLESGYTLEVKSIGKSLFYGIKSELQLLPLLIKDKKLRLNIYVPMQLGLVSQQVTTFADNSKSWDKPAFEIGAGLGFSYNFTKNIGVFGEYQLGHFYNNRKSQWKVGVLVTF